MTRDENRPPEEQPEPPSEPEVPPSATQDLETGPAGSPFPPAETETIQKDREQEVEVFPRAETEEFLGGDVVDPDISILLDDGND